MTKKARIVFMGTPDFAVGSLRTLYDEGFQIVAVITAPDRPAGRGRKMTQSAVKKFALANGLHLLQPTNLKNPEFLSEFRALEPDLQVVVAFRMLPKVVWEIPKFGTFNLHASLLPQYRGAAPINWAIINGETETGVTTFFINEAIDEGAIIFQERLMIGSEDTAGELHDKLMKLGSQLVVKTVKGILNNKVKAVQQKGTDFSLAPKLNKDNCRINWHNSVRKVHNHIRGLSPYPGAWTQLLNHDQKIELKIYRTRILEEEHHCKPGALIISKKQIKVALPDGTLEILELKLAGKRKMDSVSLLNGIEFSKDCKMI